MLIASPYASPLTLKMVTVSSLYHVGKILLISLDASRRWSPTLGIMRLLMDHWHLSSLKDALLCAKRVFLQVRCTGLALTEKYARIQGPVYTTSWGVLNFFLARTQPQAHFYSRGDSANNRWR